MSHSPGPAPRRSIEAAALAAPAAKADLRRQYRRWRRERAVGAADPGRGPAGCPGAEPRSGGPAQAGGTVLAAALRELPALLGPGLRLGLYWPLAGEEDLVPLAEAGFALALPAVEGLVPPARMVYRPWRPGEPLAADGCGIAAPLASCGNLPPAALGLLLAPALAFDPISGIRLGQGGGWYDRLRADPAWAAVPALAVVPAACLRRGLPQDPWDVPFPGWLDEEGIHRLPLL